MVGKLSYQARGIFTIVKPTRHGSYMVRRFDKPTSPKLKYMAEELYALPSTILPYELVDGSDTKYFNHAYPSIPNPLKDDLDIISYDDTYFSSPHLATPLIFNYNRDTLQFIHPSEPTPFPSIIEHHDESNTVPPSPVVNSYATIVFIPDTYHTLSLLLPDSNKLSFIQYIPTGSIRPL